MKPERVLLFFFLLGMSLFASAQNTAADHLNAINGDSKTITAKGWAYISAVSHSKSVKKVEKARFDLLKAISDAADKVSKVQPFQGDASLRDSALMYLDLTFKVFNEDYANIVNMEEVAEQSYDFMEAYMMAREQANEKLNQAQERLHGQQERFAKQHNINILDSDDEQAKNLEIANGVFKYYNELYLVFFKSYKQEAFMMNAMTRGDVSAMEQNKNSLGMYAKDGLTKLGSFSSFNNDRSLVDAGKDLLEFYVKEASEMQIAIDYFLKKEKFEKIKSAFESKKSSSRTQADVDQYNDAVKEVNEATNTYNATNQKLNSSGGNISINGILRWTRF